MLLALVNLALAADPLSIVGTWNVKLKSDMLTCPADSGERAQQWLVSTTADGSYTVQVLGDVSGTKSLKGATKDGKLILVGESTKEVPVHNAAVALRVARLQVVDGKLAGDYITTSVGEVKDLDKAGYAYALCATSWKLTATR